MAAHFADVYGARVSKDTISKITDKVIGELAEWASRPLNAVYPVIFIDAIVVKVREDKVRNTSFYVVMGVTTAGERDILGIWAGDGGEGARAWLQVFSELKNRGVGDVLIAVCDGLKGVPEAIAMTWERTIVQTCVVRLIRNSFGYAGRQHRGRHRQSVAAGLWENTWAEFVPFLEYDVEVRRVICSTNAIESINARCRRAIKARGHFPNEQSAMKCLYLLTRS